MRALLVLVSVAGCSASVDAPDAAVGPPAACLTCHAAIEAAWQHPSSPRAALGCGTCHDAVSASGPSHATTSECAACHAEATHPMGESCALCHDPHGAANGDLLRTAMPGTCQGCHALPAHAAAVAPSSCSGCHAHGNGLVPDAPANAPAGTLTVAGLPSGWNGDAPLPGVDGGPPRPFRWRVPTVGSTIDLLQDPGDPALDLEAVVLVCATSAETWSPATAPEAPGVADPSPVGSSPAPIVALRWRVDAGAPLPEGAVTCTLTAASLDGLAVHRATYAFDAAPMTAALDPFEAVDTWLITFSRDHFTITYVAGEPDTLDAVTTPNGVSDFEEALRAVGFLGKDAAFNDALLAIWRERLRQMLHGIYGLGPGGEHGPDAVRVAFVLEGDAGAPDPADFAPDGGFSLMAVGGDGNQSDIDGGFVGRADVDWNNTVENDDARFGRGVWTTQILRLGLKLGLGQVLAEIRPDVGTPLGEAPGDLDLLGTPAPHASVRGALLDVFLDLFTLGVAATCAHEMGHSLGLVPDGLPPAGLFSSVPGVPFTTKLATDGHLDVPGLNVMQTGKDLSLAELGGGLPAFEPPSRAYLLRRVIVQPKK